MLPVSKPACAYIIMVMPTNSEPENSACASSVRAVLDYGDGGWRSQEEAAGALSAGSETGEEVVVLMADTGFSRCQLVAAAQTYMQIAKQEAHHQKFVSGGAMPTTQHPGHGADRFLLQCSNYTTVLRRCLRFRHVFSPGAQRSP